MRFLRKILIISKITLLDIYIKGTPFYLTKLINFLVKPLNHYFYHPLTNLRFYESSNSFFFIRINSIYFFKLNLGKKKKLRGRGRIKRKVIRKLVAKNKILD